MLLNMKKKKSTFLKNNNIKILFFSSTITLKSNCCAIIKKGPRRGQICGKQLKKKNASYCGLHTLKKKCIGITKKGISCNSSVKKEELYCYLHNNTNAIKKNFFHDNVNKVCHLDCIQGLKKIKDNSVSIIICDPPYNIGKDFGNNSDKQIFDQYLNWCNK